MSLLVLGVMCCTLQASAQFIEDRYSFEPGDTLQAHPLVVDSGASVINQWAIAQPDNPPLVTPYGGAYVLMTPDTGAYAVNDSACFYIDHLVGPGFITGFEASFSGWYWADADTADIGKLYMSIDSGATWIDVMDDSLVSPGAVAYTPALSEFGGLSGASGGWTYFSYDLRAFYEAYDLQENQPITLRFCFLTDSVFDNRAGLMLDNLWMIDYVEGLAPHHAVSIASKAVPNPAGSQTILELTRSDGHAFTVQVWDLTGALVRRWSAVNTDRIGLDVAGLAEGLYRYQVYSPDGGWVSNGSFVVQRP